ncbi:MAG: hypothetical protein HS110_07365 [Zoogloeaceae bacterium]|nr:hypothetical protein [Zoogloeaceae bacterium]
MTSNDLSALDKALAMQARQTRLDGTLGEYLPYGQARPDIAKIINRDPWSSLATVRWVVRAGMYRQHVEEIEEIKTAYFRPIKTKAALYRAIARAKGRRAPSLLFLRIALVRLAERELLERTGAAGVKETCLLAADIREAAERGELELELAPMEQ